MQISTLGVRPITEWELIFRERHDVQQRLESIFGNNPAFIQERQKVMETLLEQLVSRYQATDAGFAWAPGRANLKGMHVDHQGSFVNPIALSQGVFFCFTPKAEGTVEIYDLKYNEFAGFDFRQMTSNPIRSIDDWTTWLSSHHPENAHWTHKIASAPVYLQGIFHKMALQGFRATMLSDNPPAAGLSSSSAMVVAVMDIMDAVNGLQLDDVTKVNYCSFAEWYVGTRGGAGDHAAIKLGQQGMITHMKTSPTVYEVSHIPFPKGYSIIIFNSGVEAAKSGPAKEGYNANTAVYRMVRGFAREYMMQHHPKLYEEICSKREQQNFPLSEQFHLADLVEMLDESDIYRIIHTLPTRITRAELRARFPADKFPVEAAMLEKRFHDKDHPEPVQGYNPHDIGVFGFAECERARIMPWILAADQSIVKLGRLMNLSHDGDRVSFSKLSDLSRHHLDHTAQSPRILPFDDDLKLYEQAGAYRASVPEIDLMCDIACKYGALGAQIVGAGLGGSMIALVQNSRIPYITQKMAELYFTPRGMDEAKNTIVASPSGGARII